MPRARRPRAAAEEILQGPDPIGPQKAHHGGHPAPHDLLEAEGWHPGSGSRLASPADEVHVEIHDPSLEIHRLHREGRGLADPLPQGGDLPVDSQKIHDPHPARAEKPRVPQKQTSFELSRHGEAILRPETILGKARLKS